MFQPPKSLSADWLQVRSVVLELSPWVHRQLGSVDGDALLIVGESLRMIRLLRSLPVSRPSVCAAALIFIAVHVAPVSLPANIDDWYGMYSQSEAEEVRRGVAALMTRMFAGEGGASAARLAATLAAGARGSDDKGGPIA